LDQVWHIKRHNQPVVGMFCHEYPLFRAQLQGLRRAVKPSRLVWSAVP